MERLLETHRFGPHRVDVVELPDDEGGSSVVVLVDGGVVTEPLPAQPRFEEVVGMYARWQEALAAG